METTVLEKLGLNKNAVTVYLVLLREGSLKAREIMKKTSLTRGLVYKALEDLEGKQIIIRRDEKNTVSKFLAIHPNVLKELIEQKVKEVEIVKKNLLNELGVLTSMYNLANNKPGVEFYEGTKGIQKMYDDVLNNITADANKKIYSFVKVMNQKTDQETSAMLNDFIKKRIRRGIKTNVLAINDVFGRALQKADPTSLRKTKLISAQEMSLDFLAGEIIISGNKLYFMSFENDVYVAIAISSKSMTQMFTLFFKSLWKSL